MRVLVNRNEERNSDTYVGGNGPSYANVEKP